MKAAHKTKFTLADLAKILQSSGLLVSSRLDNLDNEAEKNKTLGDLRTDVEKLQVGDIFLAYRGVSFDHHNNIVKAAEKNAGVILFEDANFTGKIKSTPCLQVKSSRRAWAVIAAELAQNPQKNLKILGVTGTNGKTSTVWMCRALLQAMGEKSASFGTLGAWLDQEFIATNHTTPDPDVLYPLMKKALDLGVKHLAMEVSSHAIVQEKLAPITFQGTAFTSFSRDHLDFHPDMQHYWAAKAQLFSTLSTKKSRVVLCAGLGTRLKELTISGEDIWIYGVDAKKWAAQLGIKQFVETKIQHVDFSGSKVSFDSQTGTRTAHIPYVGSHAVENFAAALLLAEGILGKEIPEKYWSTLAPVPGRLEQVQKKSHKRPGPQVFVDYAHTPDALEKSLHIIRPLTKGKVWVVFGCGGDRDKGKRPQMGKIASNLADQIVVTSDNPRTEVPGAIMEDILAGIDKNKKNFLIKEDRSEAIKDAISRAGPNDIILIAGKGHETYQIIGTKKIPFDDRTTARKFLEC